MSVALTGCFDDPGTDILWEGSIVEINEATTAAGSTIVTALEQEADGVPTPQTITINLASRPLNEAVTVTFTTSGNAIEGVHYTLGGGNTATIPAGANSVTVPYEVLTYNIGTEEEIVLGFELTDAQGAELSANYSNVNIQLQTLCTSAIPEGTYVDDISGGTAVLTKIGSNSYRLSDMNWCCEPGSGYYTRDYGEIFGEFSDVCDDLTLAGVPGEDQFGIAWIGSGTFDPATNTMTFTVSDGTYNPDATVTQVWVLQ